MMNERENMQPVFQSEAGLTLWLGDCRDVMEAMEPNSVDAIVCDPPYELGFMGKGWDSTGVAYDVRTWAAALRVLKPGGHLLAFGGTRTWHRLAVAIEDAGFDIRDSIAWMYGSGFPKSLDVAAAIDKGGAVNRERQLAFTAWMRSTGITAKTIADVTGTAMASHYLTDREQPAIATADLFDKMRPHLPEVPEEIERLVAERTGLEWTDYVKRPITGAHDSPAPMQTWRANLLGGSVIPAREKRDVAFTPEAQAWQGWGTALKPAFEPVVVARKPFPGTVAANVLAHGTGALNIDASRIGETVETWPATRSYGGDPSEVAFTKTSGGVQRAQATGAAPAGRWPANVILDESQAAALDAQSGTTKSKRAPRGDLGAGMFSGLADSGKLEGTDSVREHDDVGGASRFFYVAKASTSERPNVDGVQHATVKPLTLMRYLVRLVTPPGGIVLDPFAGSGTTLEAALTEGFEAVGVEYEADHIPLVMQRLDKPIQGTLFGDME